jgi:hypothetical protein
MSKNDFFEGEDARLFPTVNIDEDRATSVLLSTMNCVLPFRRALMDTINVKIGTRSDFKAKLHPTFGVGKKERDIPDGMILVSKSTDWRGLIEVKIKRNDLDLGQLERYLKCVRDYNCKALITISNEMCTRPDQPPLRLRSDEKDLRRIKHYHWSWKFIQSVARKLIQSGNIKDEAEKYILEQLLVFTQDDKSGVKGFTMMNQDWKEFVNKIKEGRHPSEELSQGVVSDWHQEASEIALILENEMEAEVTEILEGQSEKSAEKRMTADLKYLKLTNDLVSNFKIHGYKYPVSVVLDVDRRTYQISSRFDLTTAVKTPRKRVERFLKKFGADGQHEGVTIFAKWPRYANLTDTTLFKAIQAALDDELDETGLIMPEVSGIMYVELRLTRAPGEGNFKNTKKIISEIEKDVQFFCEHYLQ